MPAERRRDQRADPHGQLRQHRRRHLPDARRPGRVPRRRRHRGRARAPPRRSCSRSPTPRARRPAACCPPATCGTRSTGIEVTCVDNGMPVVARDGRVVRADRLRVARGAGRRRGPARAGRRLPPQGRPADGPGRRVRRRRCRRRRCSPRPRDGGQVVHPLVHPGAAAHRDRRARPRSAWSPACCCPARSGTSSPRDWPRDRSQVDVEHPTGHLLVDVVVDADATPPRVVRSGVVRTARKLFDGTAFPRAASTTTETSCPRCTTSPTSPTSRSAHRQARGVPRLLHPLPRADRERLGRRLGVPARLGRLREHHDQAHRARHVRDRPDQLPGQQPRGAAAAGGRDRGRPGCGVGWQDGDPGYGPTYVFTDPDGHEMGVYYESEWYRPPGELRAGAEEPGAGLPGPRGQRAAARPHQLPRRRRRAPTATSPRDTLGGMVTEQIVLDDGGIAGSWTTFTNKGYDAVWTRDNTGTAGPAAPPRPSPSTAATTSSAPPTSRSSRASTSRPGRTSTPSSRASSSTSRSPAGNRIELDNPGARLVLAPDWQPIDWSDGRAGQGPGLGPADHLDVPHPRHAAGGGPRPRRERHDHRLPRPLHDRARRRTPPGGTPQRAAFEAGTRPRRPTRRSPTTRSARRSRPASCA